MAGWHHWLDGHESEWTPGVGDRPVGLACCNSWGCRVGHDWATELNWTESIFTEEWIITLILNYPLLTMQPSSYHLILLHTFYRKFHKSVIYVIAVFTFEPLSLSWSHSNCAFISRTLLKTLRSSTTSILTSPIPRPHLLDPSSNHLTQGITSPFSLTDLSFSVTFAGFYSTLQLLNVVMFPFLPSDIFSITFIPILYFLI